MDFPTRTSLLDRARESVNRLQGKEQPEQSPATTQPTREPGEAARMAAAVKESGPATATTRGEVTQASSAKAAGELTPSHTPGHVPENMNQWRARAEAEPQAKQSAEAAPANAPAREPRRAEERVSADAATKPPAPAENRSKEQER